MKIDARLATDGHGHRPFTVIATVAGALSAVEVGKSIVIEQAKDQFGRDVGKNRISMFVYQTKGSRTFSCRDMRDGSVCHIFRVA